MLNSSEKVLPFLTIKKNYPKINADKCFNFYTPINFIKS